MTLENYYSILRELEDLPGFIIGGHNINDIRYANDTVLIADTDKKLQELPRKVAKESTEKGLSMNYKKTAKSSAKRSIRNAHYRCKGVRAMHTTGANECELQRTISLISHMTKLIVRILMNRARSRIRLEIGQE